MPCPPVTRPKSPLHWDLMSSADSHLDHEAATSGGGRRRITWRASALALFLPALVVAAGYAALWAYLVADGRGEGALARISLMVLFVGTPLLLAHAGLRLATTRLTLRGAHLEAHKGFPARDPEIVAYAAISDATLRRGLSGWLTGAGSLVIKRENGPVLVVPGLAHPDAALADLTARRSALLKPV